jgi:hypothetical protein
MNDDKLAPIALVRIELLAPMHQLGLLYLLIKSSIYPFAKKKVQFTYSEASLQVLHVLYMLTFSSTRMQNTSILPLEEADY